MSNDLSIEFGAHAARARYEALAPAAVEVARRSTLDTLGVMLGAGGLVDAVQPVVELARDWGGRAESTVLGHGDRLPAISAAFVNGAMGHGLDYDDHLPEGHHPSVTVLPTLLALAERAGGVDGRRWLTALAVGQDVFARLRRNVAWKQDWFLTPVLGTIASAAAGANLLGFDEERSAHAIGIASSQAAMTMQTAYGTGGDLRALYGGFAAKAAVLSVQLAERGIRATAESLEGAAGFLPVYFGDWDRAAMIKSLGTEFQGESILYKLWPSCGVSHPYVHTALTLLAQGGSVAEIERIEVVGGDFARRLCEPLELRTAPPTPNDAKFSIPFTVALALHHGGISVGDFSTERRADPDLQETARKVHFIDDPDLNWGASLPSGAVRLVMRDGEVRHAAADHDETPGAAHNPLTWEQLVAKFTDCVAHARRPLGAERVGEVVARVRDLESCSDLGELAALLG